jgi:hypothetical protein
MKGNNMADLEAAFDNVNTAQQTPAQKQVNLVKNYGTGPMRKQQFAPRPNNAPRRPFNPVMGQRTPPPPPRPQAPPGIKMLVAIPIDRVRNKRDNDFVDCKWDDILYAHDKLPLGSFADDDEGHARSFISVYSGRRTTIAQVRELPLTRMSLNYLTKDIEGLLLRLQPDLAINYRKEAERLAKHTVEIASKFKVGEIVEYRDGRASVRQ